MQLMYDTDRIIIEYDLHDAEDAQLASEALILYRSLVRPAKEDMDNLERLERIVQAARELN